MARAASLLLVLATGMLAGWFIAQFFRADQDAPAPLVESPPLPAEPTIQSLVSARDFETLARRVSDETRFIPAIASLPTEEQLQAIDSYESRFDESFLLASTRVALLARDGRFADAMDALLVAAQLVRAEDQQARFEELLERVTMSYSQELLARDALEELDSMYEQVTLALPELAEYQMQLGLLRIRTGRFDAAAIPLAQIQNHPRLGEQARALLRQAERSESLDTATAPESIPLRLSGSQFVVDAIIDDGVVVSLMIDTGAAVTVLEPAMLRQLGYSLDGRRELFATAGGVVEAPVVTLGRLALGGSGIRELAVGGMDLNLPGDIDGLLGMNFLRHFEFRIDQEGAALHLESGR